MVGAIAVGRETYQHMVKSVQRCSPEFACGRDSIHTKIHRDHISRSFLWMTRSDPPEVFPCIRGLVFILNSGKIQSDL